MKLNYIYGKSIISPSVKQHQNPSSGTPSVYQDLNSPGLACLKCHRPIKGNSTRSSSSLLSLLGTSLQIQPFLLAPRL